MYLFCEVNRNSIHWTWNPSASFFAGFLEEIPGAEGIGVSTCCLYFCLNKPTCFICCHFRVLFRKYGRRVRTCKSQWLLICILRVTRARSMNVLLRNRTSLKLTVYLYQKGIEIDLLPILILRRQLGSCSCSFILKDQSWFSLFSFLTFYPLLYSLHLYFT